jgi:hypothetical protein
MYDEASETLNPGWYWIVETIPGYSIASRYLRSLEPRITRTRKTVENRDEGEVWAVMQVLFATPRSEFPFEQFADLPNLTESELQAISPYEIGVWGAPTGGSTIHEIEDVLGRSKKAVISGGKVAKAVVDAAIDTGGKAAGALAKPLMPALIAIGAGIGIVGAALIIWKVKSSG